MEQEKQKLLEMIDRPAFTVKNGIITHCNELAKHRLIQTNAQVTTLLSDSCQAYQDFQGGILYLTLQIGWIQCGATVVRQGDEDIFLMDRDSDQAQLQSLALAAQQRRIPLSNVMTLADNLLPVFHEEAQKKQAAQMSKALFQLMRLISNMADAERYTGLDAPHFESTELCEFFRTIIDHADASAAEAKIRIRFTCTESHIYTIIDRERVERATYNLLSNAVKFSEAGSEVSVKLSKTGKLACLTVEDSGSGIASHVQGTLFHRYMREPAIEDSRFGLGLGMTLVRSTAAIHGGTVLLEQSSGTRVSMSIAIRKNVSGSLRSPELRIGDYAGGRDLGLLEFSETLPTSAYEQNM